VDEGIAALQDRRGRAGADRLHLDPAVGPGVGEGSTHPDAERRGGTGEGEAERSGHVRTIPCVSGPGPDDPGDAFANLPFFGDLSKLLGQQGPVAWDAASRLALTLASGGESEPNIDPAVRLAIEELGRVADLRITDATGLSTVVGGRPTSVVAVTRTQWVQRSLDDYRTLLDGLGAALAQDAAPGDDLPDVTAGDPNALLGGMMKMLGPMMLGMTAGSMLGHLSRRSLGQYDLPVPRGTTNEIMVVPANIDAFGADWSLPTDELRLWVCLHELAHHAVLAVPHVGTTLQGLLAEFVSGFRPDPGGLEQRLGDVAVGEAGIEGLQEVLSDPEALLGALRSPAQEALLPRIEALVAALVGYVDYVMDQVGGTLIGSYDQVTEALRRRRAEADESDRFVERLFGLELTQAVYDRGSAFVDGVVERAGAEGLERLWADEKDLPTPPEIDAPGLWLARIDLPQDPTT
jgi:putative hydrolase